MKGIHWPDLALRGFLVAIAAAAPMAFPAAEAGYNTLHDLAFLLIIPAAVLVAGAWAMLRRSHFCELAAAIRIGAIAGSGAALALEVVRQVASRS